MKIAEIIADSINEDGQRCTTFILTMPRIILAEFNTHRAISKNSASSRAIPFKKMVEAVKENPFIPLGFQKDHKGMQGTEYLSGEQERFARKEWLHARDAAVAHAILLNEGLGITKQLCNRILEPFMYHKVIATATDWENFFALRAHDQAEIHIQSLAYEMLNAYNNSSPKILKDGEWHIPFGDKFDDSRLVGYTMDSSKEELDQLRVKIATARCARISYNNFEGQDDYSKDLSLHDSLSMSGHWSPFEHCAVVEKGRHGNLDGFKQYRKFFASENRNDLRVEIKKIWN